jgi:hypothetical protein
MRRKAIGAVLMAVAALMTAYAAYAVLIGLSSANIAQLGGTGQVSVNCPTAAPCQVDQVTWTISSSAPFRVMAVNVKWTPASDAPASYTVYVTLYDGSNNIVGSGSAAQTGAAALVTTSVPVSGPSPIDPKDVYKVEIVIVQTAF